RIEVDVWLPGLPLGGVEKTANGYRFQYGTTHSHLATVQVMVAGKRYRFQGWERRYAALGYLLLGTWRGDHPMTNDEIASLVGYKNASSIRQLRSLMRKLGSDRDNTTDSGIRAPQSGMDTGILAAQRTRWLSPGCYVLNETDSSPRGERRIPSRGD